METRTINEIKVYILRLNDMRMSNIEQSKSVAFSFDENKLINWIVDQECERYLDEDGRWSKSFKKGSALEWYNPPDSHYNQGIIYMWMTEWNFNKFKDGSIFDGAPLEIPE